MKSTSNKSLLPTLAVFLMASLFSCNTPANSSTISTAAAPEKAETTPQENGAVTNSPQAKENRQPLCVTWDEYQAVEPSSNGLQMPPGFEYGCVFRIGESRGRNIEILRNDIGLETIVEPGTTSFTSNPIPWLQGNQISDQYAEQSERGNILNFYQACTTIGGQESYCEGFPQNEAYIINDNTACFRGQCLIVPDVHAIYLLSLWPWNNEIYDLPTSFSRNGTFSRTQYRTIPLNRLPQGTPLVGRSREDIARAAYGRGALEEGEQPTVITDTGWNTEDGVSVVFLTNQGSADDSIGGFRYRLDFSSVDGDQSKLIWVGQQHYCRRGEQEGWTTETCS